MWNVVSEWSSMKDSRFFFNWLRRVRVEISCLKWQNDDSKLIKANSYRVDHLTLIRKASQRLSVYCVCKSESSWYKTDRCADCSNISVKITREKEYRRSNLKTLKERSKASVGDVDGVVRRLLDTWSASHIRKWELLPSKENSPYRTGSRFIDAALSHDFGNFIDAIKPIHRSQIATHMYCDHPKCFRIHNVVDTY